MKTKRLSRHQSRSRIRTRRPSSLLLFTASQAPSHGSLRARATLMMMETAAIHLTTIVRARFASSSSSPFLSRPEKSSARASSRVTPIRRSQCRSTAFRSSRGPNRCLLSALATHHMSMEMAVRIKNYFASFIGRKRHFSGSTSRVSPRDARIHNEIHLNIPHIFA